MCILILLIILLPIECSNKNIRARENNSRLDKTDDKFLDSKNIKENMIKNDFNEERRISNKE